MGSSPPKTGIPGRGVLPDWGDEDALKDYKDAYFNYYNIFRARNLERQAMNLHYLYLRQWIELDVQRLGMGGRGFFFKDIDSPNANMPKPVTNYIGAAVNIELAGLSKKELIPTILVTSRDPRIEAAGKVAKEVLNDRLKKLCWSSLREEFTTLAIVTGNAVFKSYWDETTSEMASGAVPEPMGCPNCSTLLASPQVPVDKLGSMPVQHSESIQDAGEGMATVSNCPTCPEPTPMQPVELDEGLAQGSDYFGRPLSMDLPKGNTAIELVSPFDIWPENMGVDVDTENCRMWGQSTVRSLDWIEERFPGYECEPENPSELMKWHPILGDATLMGWFDQQYDSGIYENHARLYELHIDKCGKYPDGRSIRWVGDHFINDEPLYRTVGQRKVATVKYCAARFETIHRSFWGRGLVDSLISPQNRLNGLDSQIIEARIRMGSPNLMFTENMAVDGPEFFEDGGGGKFLRYQTDPLNPSAKPEVWGSILMPAEAYQERMSTIQDMKEIAGPQDVEQGEAPRNVGTTSGLQLLYERSDQRRSPRSRNIINAFRKLWEHQLELLCTLRVTPDDYESEAADGSWESKEFDKEKLAGQCKLKIESQADIEKSVYQKESAREAQADGLILPNNQQAIKRLLELRGLPTDVNEDLNLQVDLAKRQWVRFFDEGVMPVIDPSIDDPRIHFQGLATLLLGEEGQKVQEEMDWPGTLKKIAGWETEYQKTKMLADQVRQIYSPMQSPEQNNEVYAASMVNFTEQKESFSKMGEANAKAGLPPDGTMQPPVMPPPPVFMPADRADLLYMVWKQMIDAQQMQQQGQMGAPGGQPGMPGEQAPMPPTADEMMQMQQQMQMQDNFLHFMSVVIAYKLLAEEREAQMMMGMPGAMAPAPGTPEGNPGMGGALPGIQAANTNPSGPQPPAGVKGPSPS